MKTKNENNVFKLVAQTIMLIVIIALCVSIYLLYQKDGLSSLVGSLTAITGGIVLLTIIFSPSPAKKS